MGSLYGQFVETMVRDATQTADSQAHLTRAVFRGLHRGDCYMIRITALVIKAALHSPRPHVQIAACHTAAQMYRNFDAVPFMDILNQYAKKGHPEAIRSLGRVLAKRHDFDVLPYVATLESQAGKTMVVARKTLSKLPGRRRGNISPEFLEKKRRNLINPYEIVPTPQSLRDYEMDLNYASRLFSDSAIAREIYEHLDQPESTEQKNHQRPAPPVPA